VSKRRLNVDLTQDAYERLSEAADSQGTTLAEFVRRAINLDLFLRKQASDDGTITVEGAEGRTQVLVR
jgi:hypothetical protein